MDLYIGRRRFLVRLSMAAAAALLARRNSFASTIPTHPSPRRGITGNRVLTELDLEGAKPDVIQLFNSIREIPQVIDGIHCNCGCTHPPEYYSLLSCFEGKGMARDCIVCQGQGKLAVRLHKEGKSLDEIRAAIDIRFA